MEVLAELVAKISADATELKKGLSDAERKTEASSKNMADALKKIGIAMAASGAAITAAMGAMGKAAIDEEINIKHLQVALKGVGVNYDSVKDSLEKVISTTQRKTGIADNQQRDVLSQLILVTKDYDKALKLLPLALDLATYAQMDTRSAATYLGKAFEELEAGADKIGIRMGTTTIYFKDLDEVQKMVGGTAEAMVNPFSQVAVAMSDLSEVIGGALIPYIKQATGTIVDIISKIQEWANVNPELAKTLTLITTGAGGVLALTSGIILLMPQITKLAAGFKTIAVAVGIANGSLLAFSLSMAGLLAGIALLTYGISYITDREKAYNDVKITGMQLDVQREKYLKGEANNYQEILSKYIPMVEAYIAMSGAKGEDVKAQREWIAQAKDGLKAMEQLKTKGVANAEETKKNADKIKRAIQDLGAEYGDLGNAIRSKGDMARAASQVAKDALATELDKARESANEQIRLWDKVYSAKIKTETDATNERIGAIQDEIDELDNQTEKENRALEDKYDREKQSTLKGKELVDFIAEVERKKELRKREDIKETLRQKIEKEREDLRNTVQKLNTELQEKQDNERKMLAATENRIKEANIKLDLALKTELDRLADELREKQANLTAQLIALDTKLGEEERLNQASLNRRLMQDREYAASRASIFGGGIMPGMGPAPPGGSQPIAGPVSPSDVFFSPMANGGIVTQPTMGLIGEAGPEAVIPLNEAGAMGGVTINFTQPVFFDREDTMNKFVKMIRDGIQRQDRLRFGGAWNGS